MLPRIGMCPFVLNAVVALTVPHCSSQPETKTILGHRQRSGASLKVRVPYSSSRWRMKKGSVVGHDLLAVPNFGIGASNPAAPAPTPAVSSVNKAVPPPSPRVPLQLRVNGTHSAIPPRSQKTLANYHSSRSPVVSPAPTLTHLPPSLRVFEASKALYSS